jgi:hypothetical protein
MILHLSVEPNPAAAPIITDVTSPLLVEGKLAAADGAISALRYG